MKNPSLSFVSALLAIISLSNAYAGSGDCVDCKALPPSNFKQVLGKIGLGFREIASGVKEGAIDVKDGTKDFFYKHPLPIANNINLKKDAHGLSIEFCEAPLVATITKQKCEKLHKGYFTANELRGCLKNAGANKQPGMALDRDLADFQKNKYPSIHYQMFNSRENYQAYLNTCQAQLSAKRVVLPKAFKPVEELAPIQEKSAVAAPAIAPVTEEPAKENTVEDATLDIQS